jgi:hypothetical protein
MILPMKTPPQMLQPPDVKWINGALVGLQKFGVTEEGLTKMTDQLLTMTNHDAALNLLEEIDHLIWLASIWLHIEHFMVDVEFDESRPSETAARWCKAPIEKIHWCLLDRYRSVGMDEEAKAWIEHNAVPF